MEIETRNLTESQKTALAAEYERVLAFCADESAEYSLSHYRKMCRITGIRLTPSASVRKKKKRLAAILIAAAMLIALVGCTAIVYRERIGEFFTEAFEDHIKGSFSDEVAENNMIIEEYYTLTYVPEGYEFVEENVSRIYARYVWRNGDGEKLTFKQTPINSSYYLFDNENGNTDIIECRDYSVYYRIIEDTYCWIWNNKEYAFMLWFDKEMNEKEIVRIVEGMQLQQ